MLYLVVLQKRDKLKVNALQMFAKRKGKDLGGGFNSKRGQGEGGKFTPRKTQVPVHGTEKLNSATGLLVYTKL